MQYNTNRLTQVTKNGTSLGTYAYDANGIRAKKVENGATTHYLALGHTVMYEKTGAVGTRHIFAGSQRIAEVRGTTTSYFHNDHLGSPRVVTDASGIPGSSMATKPFGEPHAGSAQTSYGFTGKELDSTGLYYFAARYYDASVGRFVSQDTHWNHHNMIYGDDPDNKFPLISAITQSTNLYVYCGNNPIMYVDPDGEIFFMAGTGIIGVAVGGIVGAIHAKVTGGNVSQGLLKGAVIGGAIGLTGGAATAFLATGSAAASLSTVLGSFGVKVGGTIVIGQTMDRVNDATQKYGSEVYRGLNAYKAIEDTFGETIAQAIGLVDNAAWLLNKMVLDYRIIDIGLDPKKTYGSISYSMENLLSFFYQNKEMIR